MIGPALPPKQKFNDNQVEGKLKLSRYYHQHKLKETPKHSGTKFNKLLLIKSYVSSKRIAPTKLVLLKLVHDYILFSLSHTLLTTYPNSTVLSPYPQPYLPQDSLPLCLHFLQQLLHVQCPRGPVVERLQVGQSLSVGEQQLTGGHSGSGDDPDTLLI